MKLHDWVVSVYSSIQLARAPIRKPHTLRPFRVLENPRLGPVGKAGKLQPLQHVIQFIWNLKCTPEHNRWTQIDGFHFPTPRPIPHAFKSAIVLRMVGGGGGGGVVIRL